MRHFREPCTYPTRREPDRFQGTNLTRYNALS
jgi:hypothetical protein